MMNRLPAFLGTSLAVLTTGIAAKTAVATEKLALKEVAPLMQQALVKDTLTLLPQAEKTLDNAGSVLLPQAGLLADWGGHHRRQNQGWGQPYPTNNVHYVETYKCTVPQEVTYYNPYHSHQTQAGVVYKVIDHGNSAPASQYTDHQKQTAIHRCANHGGTASFGSGIYRSN
jgi:hypothetical protein